MSGPDRILEDRALRNREAVFVDRDDAGRQLAGFLRPRLSPQSLVLAIPSGGVPVGRVIVDLLGFDLDLCIVRKAQIPWNTEAGFGAVNLDGDAILNEALILALRLSDTAVSEQLQKTREVLKHRNRLFRGNTPDPNIKGRSVVLVDDGVASGYTMSAAIRFVQRRNPLQITVAVPTGSLATVQRLSSEADCVCCLNVRDYYPFAVAGAYTQWRDLTDDDVLGFLPRKT